KKTPTAAENRKPPAIAREGTSVGHPATSEITFEVTSPATMPAPPPMTLRSTASARNCRSTWYVTHTAWLEAEWSRRRGVDGIRPVFSCGGRPPAQPLLFARRERNHDIDTHPSRTAIATARRPAAVTRRTRRRVRGDLWTAVGNGLGPAGGASPPIR